MVLLRPSAMKLKTGIILKRKIHSKAFVVTVVTTISPTTHRIQLLSGQGTTIVRRYPFILHEF